MLSYSGLTSYGKVGIPSVEGWGTSMNIMKDPPKSIYTKRKDKVGTTSHITQQIEDSGDRHNEAILKFARGINQFTDVEYSNNGSNIGRGSNNNIIPGGPVQAKLPNRIMKDGDFRPPVIAPQDLLPLSRPRRPNSSMVTNIDNVDFTHKPYSFEHKQNGREINKQYNTNSVVPTKTYKLERTIGQTMKDYIRERIPMYVSSQKTNGALHYEVIRGDTKNVSAVHDGIPRGHFQTQVGNPMHQYNNNVDTERYTRETYVNPVTTTKTSGISNIINDVDGDYIQVRNEIPNISVSGIKSSSANNPSQHNYQNNLIYTKNVPNHSANTNTRGTGESDNTSRQYSRLPTRTPLGSFMNNGSIPSTHKDTTIMLRQTNKQDLLKKMKTYR
jgi:hypothetical protein